MPGRFLNVREVAETLGIAPETVRTMARRGEIPAFKMGSSSTSPYRFDAKDVELTIARWKRQSR